MGTRAAAVVLFSAKSAQGELLYQRPERLLSASLQLINASPSLTYWTPRTGAAGACG